MAEMKTVPTRASVAKFLAAVPDETRRADSKAVLAMMKRVTGLKPVMWGPSIVGFGKYHYRYESGRAGDMPLAAFSPRKNELTVYLPGFEPYRALLDKLGKHTTGKVCLYIKRLADVDLKVLERLIATAYRDSRKRAAGG